MTRLALLALLLQGLVPLAEAGQPQNGPDDLDRDLRVICTAYGIAVVGEKTDEDGPGSHLDCPVCQSPDLAAGLPGPGPAQALRWSAPVKARPDRGNGGFAADQYAIGSQPRAPPKPA